MGVAIAVFVVLFGRVSLRILPPSVACYRMLVLQQQQQYLVPKVRRSLLSVVGRYRIVMVFLLGDRPLDERLLASTISYVHCTKPAVLCLGGARCEKVYE